MRQTGVVNSRVGLSRNEEVKIAIVYALLGLVTVFAFLSSVWVGTVTVLLAGLGVVSYVLGLNHGMDADHIAAMDNTTRKLMNQKQSASTVGMWFSLGHSVIVAGLVVALIFVTKAVIGKIPALESGGAFVGTLVSGVFLFLIGIINLVIVRSVYQTFKELKQGKLTETDLQRKLDKAPPRGFRALFKLVNHSWQIFPIGILFGLGFDTATQVALIALSVGIGVTSKNVPLWMILVLPLMFTCGMVLTDTSYGVATSVAYGWAFLNPIRKVYFNLTITIVSVLVAFAIAGIEIVQVVTMNLTSPFWVWFGNLDFEFLGVIVVALFVGAFITSYAIWKIRRIDENYQSMLSRGHPT